MNPDPYPDSPVVRVRIEHADGTVKQITGDEAKSWASSVDAAVAEATIRGRDIPNKVDWDTWTVDREDDRSEGDTV